MKIRKGFSIIESLIYIFMTTLIINEGLYLTMLMYKSYIHNSEITKRYNGIQNFYLEFQEIASEINIDKIECIENKLVFSKYVDNMEKKKSIEFKSDENSIVVKTYDLNDNFLSENKMLGNVKKLSFVKKNKLIYMIVCDEDGKEFISCI